MNRRHKRLVIIVSITFFSLAVSIICAYSLGEEGLRLLGKVFFWMLIPYLARELGKYFRRIGQIYFFHLLKFSFPLFVESAMIKLRYKFSEKEFKRKTNQFEREGMVKDHLKTDERLGIGNFILTKDGSIILGYFDKESRSPKRRRNPLKGFWIGIPAILWIIMDFFFIYFLCYNKNQKGLVTILFLVIFLYSLFSLSLIFIFFSSKIKETGLYPRWIFVIIPLIIAIHETLGYFNPHGILFLWFIGLFLLLSYETLYELDNYLEALSKPLFGSYRRICLRLYSKKPICWLMLTRSFDDILDLSGSNNIANSGKVYQVLYFRKFFDRKKIPSKTFRDKIRHLVCELKLLLGIVEKDYVEAIRAKISSLQAALIDNKEMNLLLPYIIRPTQAQDPISGRCLISYSEEKIVGINLPEKIANYMAQDGDLWKARNLKDVVSSYVKYHYHILLEMKKEIASPLNPLVDPFKLQNSPELVKNDITSLIRFEALLTDLKQSNIYEITANKLSLMRGELRRLIRLYKEFLEMSNVIFQAENSKKITKLTGWVIFLTFAMIITSFFKIEEISISFSQIGLFTYISDFVNLLGPGLIGLFVFLATKRK